jgi:lysyl endopeptidase
MKKFLIFILILGRSVFILSQINTHEVPPSFKESLNKNEIASVKMSTPDFKLIHKEDSIDFLKGLPPRFGYGFKVNITIDNSGNWIELPDKNGRLWQFEIDCPGALSINLLYDKFYIPEGGKFFIYSADKKQTLGAFTKRNNKGDKAFPEAFATSLIMNDKIILEYFEPNNSSESPIISIAQVVQGYRYITPFNFGDSNGSCEININCTLGQNWQDEKTSVALIVVGGTRWCTGSLINNTSGDGTPYLLTANHCLDGLDAISNPNASTWSFLWNYESPTCQNGTDFTPPSTSGATVIANNSTSDFALLKLAENPFDLSPSLCLYYNGWDRTATAASSSTCIHHPEGDIKKISVSNTSATTSNNTWQVIFNQGIVEPGSSGSPLFNQNSRVVGQLLGASTNDPISCQNPDGPTYFGKFFISWDNSTDSRRQLKHWLDPLGTTPYTLDGTYRFPLTNCYVSGPTLVCSSGATFTVNNLHSGCTVSWSKSSNLTLSSANGNTAVFSAGTGASSSGWIQATINSITCGSVALPQYIVWAGTPQITNQKVDGSYYSPGKQICPGNHWLDVTPVGEGAGNATWTVPSGIQYIAGNNTLDFTFPSNLSSISISARSANSCGTSSNANFYLTKKTSGCPNSIAMTLYPNPASDNVTITMDDNLSMVSNYESDSTSIVITNSKTTEITSYTIRIYNSQSALLSTFTRSGTSFNIPLINMRDGSYIIEVSDGKTSYIQTLIVKHN